MFLSTPTKSTPFRSLTMSGTSQKTRFCVVQPVISKPIGNNIVPGTMLATVRMNGSSVLTEELNYDTHVA